VVQDLLSDVQQSHPGRGYFLKLLVAIAFLVVAFGSIDTILSRSLFLTFVTGPPGPNSFDAYNLILALYNLGYLAVFFLVFYFIGLRPGISISRDWLTSLEYLFIGGLLGETLELLAAIGITTVLYGDQFGFGSYTTIAGWLYNIVWFVHNGGEQALVAFAGLVVGAFLRPTAANESATEPREPMAAA